MERLGVFVVSRPRLVIGAILVFTVLLAAQLRNLKLEVSLRGNVPPDHPYTLIEDEMSSRFGTGKTALVALGVHEGDIFTTRTLTRLRRLTDAVSHLPGVVSTSVLSLASPRVKVLTAEGDDLRVAPLLEEIPTDPAALAALRQAAFSYPMYVGNLITADGKGALVLADFVQETPNGAITDALEALAAAERDDNTDVYVGGQPRALAALEHATRGIAPIMGLALVVIALVHYEAFRTGQSVLLPLVTAIMSVLWGTGLMALFGFKLEPWSAITSILILSVAAGHAVQILKRYYECFAELHDTRAAVVASLVRVGPVMVTAGLVAAAGFSSLATFGVPAVRDFGLTAAFGILSALAIELTFIPAVRALLPAPRARETSRERQHRFLDPALEWIADQVCTRPRVVLGTTIAIVLLAAAGMLRLHINLAVRGWFSPRDQFILADRIINDRFTGTTSIRILVEGDGEEPLLDPAIVKGMVSVQQALATEPSVSATLSFADYLAVMNRAMHDNDPAAYRVPDSRSLIAQYLLLYGPTDLDRVISADFRKGAIYALSRSDDVAWAEALFERIRQHAAGHFPPGVRVRVAGGEVSQAAAANHTVVREKLLNMLQVSSVIFVLCWIVFRSAVGGLLVLAPLACAALVNLGLMGWWGSWLSFATAMYTAMGVSLGADFAIYLLFRLREERRRMELAPAIREALRTSGKAIFFVAAAIVAGYATLLVSGFALWRQLGGYVALMMSTSALATLTLLPSLVLLRPPRFLTPAARAPKADRPAAASAVAGERRGAAQR